MTAAARTLNVDDLDRADKLAAQIDGILDCVAAASQAECLPDQAIPNACWAASALLEQLRAVFEDKPLAGEVTQ